MWYTFENLEISYLPDLKYFKNFYETDFFYLKPNNAIELLRKQNCHNNTLCEYFLIEQNKIIDFHISFSSPPKNRWVIFSHRLFFNNDSYPTQTTTGHDCLLFLSAYIQYTATWVLWYTTRPRIIGLDTGLAEKRGHAWLPRSRTYPRMRDRFNKAFLFCFVFLVPHFYYFFSQLY